MAMIQLHENEKWNWRNQVLRTCNLLLIMKVTMFREIMTKTNPRNVKWKFMWMLFYKWKFLANYLTDMFQDLYFNCHLLYTILTFHFKHIFKEAIQRHRHFYLPTGRHHSIRQLHHHLDIATHKAGWH